MIHKTKLSIPKFPNFYISEALSVAELKTIENLAKKIWNEYYPGIISQKQISYMLRKMYSLQVMKNQIKKNILFYIIYKNSKPIGYFSISKKDRKKYFLHKFYILSNLRSKGLGTAVFKKILRMFKPDSVELTVNRQNFKAINFYFKIGFQIEKVEDFDIGNGFYMNDFVMKWKKKTAFLDKKAAKKFLMKN